MSESQRKRAAPGNMDTIENRRREERVPYHSPLQFTVLSMKSAEFQRMASTGEIIDASVSGVGIITEFPLKPGDVVEWNDKHQKGKLHIALVFKWSLEQGDHYRAGLVFI